MLVIVGRASISASVGDDMVADEDGMTSRSVGGIHTGSFEQIATETALHLHMGIPKQTLDGDAHVE